ncbi:MAG: hypothetical protein K6F91_03525 [Ruminococcus sp.]|nr:hypothetical protein [Ruminococcus sp.]
MKSRIIYCLNFLWTGVVAFFFPICFACIYLDITGHSKGYDYDLGVEKDFYAGIGAVELMIWAALALPSLFYVFRKTQTKGKAYVLIISIFYIALAVIGLLAVFHSPARFIKAVFNIDI